MNVKAQLMAAAIATMLAGCASFDPPKYRPHRAGSLNDGENGGSIAVTIRPDQDSVRRGDVIDFTVAIRNVGAQELMLPRDPDLILTWTYADGRCDNQVRDAATVVPVEMVRLLPGEELVRRSSLKTYYFHSRGITEFRAIVSAAGPAASWTGRAVSNGFGIMVN